MEMSKMKRIENKKGFTIIEVVLVLAIAGLIFLMVFIALPALQRGQRDTQRRADVDRVVAAVTSYQSNNRNRIPTDAELTATREATSSFIKNYLLAGGDTFEDPNGDLYKFKVRGAGQPVSGVDFNNTENGRGVIHFVRGATCNGENAEGGKGAAKIAFLMKLEGGGVVCKNN